MNTYLAPAALKSSAHCTGLRNSDVNIGAKSVYVKFGLKLSFMNCTVALSCALQLSQNHSLPVLGTEYKPQVINIPIFPSSYHFGKGLESIDLQFGSYLANDNPNISVKNKCINFCIRNQVLTMTTVIFNIM